PAPHATTRRQHPRPPRGTPFPYTTLFRPAGGHGRGQPRERSDRDDARGGRALARQARHRARRGRPAGEGRRRPLSRVRRRWGTRSEEHTSELQSRENLVCRLLVEKRTYEG